MSFPEVLVNGNVSLSDVNNYKFPYLLKDLSYNYSSFVNRCNIMLSKGVISLNQQFDISKIGIYQHQRRGITEFTFTDKCISPIFLKINNFFTCDVMDFDVADDNVRDDDDHIKVLSND